MPSAGPNQRHLAIIAWAIDPSAAAWARTFALADRVERADPAHAEVAPLRTRINLLAMPLRIRPEVDLWPLLRGVVGSVMVDRAGRLDGVVVMLQAVDEASADRISTAVLPRLAPALGLQPEPDAQPGPDRVPAGVCHLGRYRDRSVTLERRGACVRLAWGETTGARAEVRPGPRLRDLVTWDDRQPLPQRFGAFWPSRLDLPAFRNVGETLARTLEDAGTEPLVWTGRDGPSATQDLIRWSGLRSLIHRFLERVPLDLPGDHR